MPRKLLFESVTCSRCGGSGNYSYCQMYGTTCFKCAGDGATLTARGKAAQAWLNAKRRKAGNEVAVGEWILIEGVPGFSRSYWAKVVEVSGAGAEHKIVAESKSGERQTLNGFGEIQIRVSFTKEQKAAQAAEALAFQATLTKAGTVRKRAAKSETAKDAAS
jgi:hypothetical protein